jgi:hypothetical protein
LNRMRDENIPGFPGAFPSIERQLNDLRHPLLSVHRAAILNWHKLHITSAANWSSVLNSNENNTRVPGVSPGHAKGRVARVKPRGRNGQEP